MNITELLAPIKKRLEEAAQKWGPYDANIPFYAVVRKPRPSLSKNDDISSTLWRVEDAKFLACAHDDLSHLVAALEVYEKEFEKIDQHLCEQIIDPCGFVAKDCPHEDLVQLVNANSDLNDLRLKRLREARATVAKILSGGW